MQLLRYTLAILIGIAVFTYLWWAGARLHRSVHPNARTALRVKRLIARFLGSKRSDNLVNIAGVGLQMLSIEWAIVVLLIRLTSMPMSDIQTWALVFTIMMILVGSIHYWRNSAKRP